MNNDDKVRVAIRDYPDETNWQIAKMCGVRVQTVSRVKVLVSLRDYPDETDLQIARMCGARIRDVERLRFMTSKIDPKTRTLRGGTYFIKDQQNHVKIGTSANVAGRLATLQTANADNLTLLGVLDEEETDLHDKFAQYHIRGEWFTLSDEIKEYLDEMHHRPL